MNDRPNGDVERLFFMNGVDPRSHLENGEVYKDESGTLYVRFQVGNTTLEAEFGEDEEGVFSSVSVVSGDDIEEDDSFYALMYGIREHDMSLRDVEQSLRGKVQRG